MIVFFQKKISVNFFQKKISLIEKKFLPLQPENKKLKLYK